MRYIVVFLILFFSAPIKTEGQARITSVTIGSGESAVVSGLSGIFTFETASKKYVEVAMMQQIAWVAYGPQFKGFLDGFAAVSVGHMFTEPWFGPYLVLSKNVGPCRVGTMQWPAIFAKVPDEFDGESRYGHLGNVSISCGPVSGSWAINKFLDSPWNSLPGIAVDLPLLQNISFTSSSTWNVNKQKLMLYIGLSWRS